MTETVSYLKGLLPEDAIWSAVGPGPDEQPIAAQSILLGGNVRVDLERTDHIRKDRHVTGEQPVDHVKQLIEILGHEVATPKDARRILGLDTLLGSFT